MADVAGEPHVGDHTGAVHIAQGDGFAGLDADAGAEFLAILAGSAAVACAGGILGGKTKGRPVMQVIHRFLLERSSVELVI